MVLGWRPGHLAEPGTRGGECRLCPIPLQNPCHPGSKSSQVFGCLEGRPAFCCAFCMMFLIPQKSQKIVPSRLLTNREDESQRQEGQPEVDPNSILLKASPKCPLTPSLHPSIPVHHHPHHTHTAKCFVSLTLTPLPSRLFDTPSRSHSTCTRMALVSSGCCKRTL